MEGKNTRVYWIEEFCVVFFFFLKVGLEAKSKEEGEREDVSERRGKF